MNHEISFKGYLSHKDFMSLRTKSSYILSFIVLFIFFLLTYWYRFYDNLRSGIFVITIISTILISVIMYLTYKNRVRSVFNSDAHMKLERVYTLDQEGILVKTKRSYAKFIWDDVKSVIEQSDIFVIRISFSVFIIIPKDFLKSIDNIENFKAFIALHCPDKVKFIKKGR